MSSIQNSIKIFARIKPISYKPIDYEIAYRDCLETDEFLNFSLKSSSDSHNGYINNKQEHYSYRFTQVFDRDCEQSQIFEAVAKPVVDSALEGYNGTIFVYGQTGSGKTYTMTGSREIFNERGVIPRTIQYVFDRFGKTNSESTLQAAFVSYLEIYNEGGYDLLHSGEEFLPSRLEELVKVTLMEDGQQQMHLKNLTVHPVSSEEEALHLLYLGDRNRTVAETPLNEASTRSHCIFTIHISLRSTTSSTVRRSKIHLVDLAGSERIANSNISGQLLCEARHINLALHYLEQVIVSLGNSNAHIPYRNSFMTSILRDSLGGNCMTSMIATVSIEPKNIQETLSTCRFSQRVALVTNAAIRNEELDPQLMIASLKQEIKRLKDMLLMSNIKPINAATTPLTMEEYSKLICLLDGFLSDKDPNTILAVEPDMRMIQACFQILKGTINKRNVDDQNKNALMIAEPRSEYTQSHVPTTEETYDQLSQKINDRDREINDLVQALRRERLKQNSVEGAMDSNQNPVSDIEVVDGALLTKYIDKELQPTESESLEVLDDAYYPEEEEEILRERKICASTRKALNNYMKTHQDVNEMKSTRVAVLEKRHEIQRIEKDLRKNMGTMNSLKDIMEKTFSDRAGSDNIDYANLEKALISQQRTISMQQNRLCKAQEKMAESVNELKTKYDKLLMDFEFDRRDRENALVVSTRDEKSTFGEAIDILKRILLPNVATEIFQEMESFVSNSCRRN